MLGPFEIDRGRTTIMRSATGVDARRRPSTSGSPSCAPRATRCITQALGPDGQARRVAARAGAVPRVAAQRVSRGAELPVVPHAGGGEHTPIASVLGEPRETLARHTFLGGNFFMLRHAQPLSRRARRRGAAAGARGGGAAPRVRQLQSDTATRRLSRGPTRLPATLELDVDRAQPSPVTSCRPAIPHGAPGCTSPCATAAGRVVFESGARHRTGMIGGNDNDADPLEVRAALRGDPSAGRSADLRVDDGRCRGTA